MYSDHEENTFLVLLITFSPPIFIIIIMCSAIFDDLTLQLETLFWLYTVCHYIILAAFNLQGGISIINTLSLYKDIVKPLSLRTPRK